MLNKFGPRPRPVLGLGDHMLAYCLLLLAAVALHTWVTLVQNGSSTFGFRPE